MPRPFGIENLPAPPGIENQDPLYQVLSRYLDGPTRKLYYDWGIEMRNDPTRKDKWKKGDNLAYKAWLEGVRNAIRRNMEPQSE